MFQIDSQPFLPWAADDTLTVTSVRPNSSNATATVSVFATYPGAVREARPTNAVFTIQEAKVTFSTDDVTFDLKPRDTLAFGSQTWTVKSATDNPFLKFWDVQVFRLVIQTDLCDSIVVKRPTATQTDGGFRSVSLSTIATVSGKVQSDGVEDVDIDGRLTKRERFKAYLGTTTTLYAGDVLTVGSTNYEVVAQSDLDQLETFSYASCVRVS